MNTTLRILLAAICVSAAPPQESSPKLDLHGDPLPYRAVVRLGSARFLHHQRAACLTYTSDGRRLVSAGDDGVVHVWDAATGQLLEATPVAGAIAAVAISPDGRSFTVGAKDGTVAMYRFGSRESIWKSKCPNHNIVALRFSPDGRTLASARWPENLALHDAATGTVTHERQLELGEIRRSIAEVGSKATSYEDAEKLRGQSIAIDPDGQTFRAPGLREEVRVWDVRVGKHLYTTPRLTPRKKLDLGMEDTVCVTTSRGDLFATTFSHGDGNSAVRLCDVKTGREIRQLAHGGDRWIREAALSPDGTLLATVGRDTGLHLWNCSTGRDLFCITDQFHSFGGLCFSPDGKTLAVCDTIECRSHHPSVIRRWETATGRELERPTSPDGAIQDLAFSPDGEKIAVGTATHQVSVWRASDGGRLFSISPPKIFSTSRFFVSFLPGGELVSSENGRVLVYRDATTGKRLHEFKFGDDKWSGPILSDDRRHAAFWQEHKDTPWDVHILDLAERKEVGGGVLNNAIVISFGWPPFVYHPVRANIKPDREIIPPDAVKESTRTVFRPERKWQRIATTSDGRYAASQVTSDYRPGHMPEWKISVWHPGLQLPLLEIPQEIPREDDFDCTFSPDGKWLATSSSTQEVIVWEMASCRPIRRFPTQGLRLSTAPIFSPDGGRLATGFDDGTVLIWNLGPTLRPPGATGKDLDTAWRLLADNDPATAFEAGFTFDNAPVKAVAFLGARLAPVPHVAKRISALIRALDVDEFDVREKATQELIDLGKLAEKAVREVQTTSTSPEARRRAERILRRAATPPPPSPDTIRALRAVQILQRLNTPQARKLLERLASGEPSDRLTEEARASLDFIVRR
jgi:WD40 repeat protein